MKVFSWRGFLRLFVIKKGVMFLIFTLVNSSLVFAEDLPIEPSPPVEGAVSNAQDVKVLNVVNVNIKNKVALDLGDGTGVDVAPTLDSTPVLAILFKPLIDWVDGLKSWHVPAHLMECPRPSTILFNRVVVMDTHCTLVENVRPQLQGTMAFVYVVVAFYIVVSA